MTDKQNVNTTVEDGGVSSAATRVKALNDSSNPLFVKQPTPADLNVTEVNSGDIKTAVEAIAADANASEISSIPAPAAVTDSETNVTLVRAEILNDGVNTIFYKNVTGVDTDDYPLYPGERMSPLKGTIYIICAAGLTSTLRIAEFV